MNQQEFDTVIADFRERAEKAGKKQRQSKATPERIGSGPENETCKSCVFSYKSDRFWKCACVKATRGAGTDIRLKWSACSWWNPRWKLLEGYLSDKTDGILDRRHSVWRNGYTLEFRPIAGKQVKPLLRFSPLRGSGKKEIFAKDESEAIAIIRGITQNKA